MKKFKPRISRLELVAFVAGFELMVFELAGARILAPGIGSSTYVWTSVIGVIIAALSLGYWVGGMIADKRGHMIDVARLLLVAGLAIVMTMLQYDKVITWVAESFDDSRMQGVVASLILFAPVSFVLGTISPYLAKLNVRSLTTTGRSIASLSALNSIGGIIGTFVTGFILFGYIGSHQTLAMTAIMMAAVSWLIAPSVNWRIRTVASATIVLFAIHPLPTTGVVSIDTPSARYTIFETADARLLATGPNSAQSGISLFARDELVFWYTEQLADVVAATPERKNILILGGGAFTLPQYLATKYPSSNIDVVEIDPELAKIARERFDYDDPSNVNLIFADARTYVNQTAKQYDIVLVDVYGDAYVPFTLLTGEYGDHINQIVAPNGIVAANLIAGLEGECSELLRALDAPYHAYFQHAEYTIEQPDKNQSNIVAVYSHQPVKWSGANPFEMSAGTIPYSDNYAPAERLQHACRPDRDFSA